MKSQTTRRRMRAPRWIGIAFVVVDAAALVACSHEPAPVVHHAPTNVTQSGLEEKLAGWCAEAGAPQGCPDVDAGAPEGGSPTTSSYEPAPVVRFGTLATESGGAWKRPGYCADIGEGPDCRREPPPAPHTHVTQGWLEQRRASEAAP